MADVSSSEVYQKFTELNLSADEVEKYRRKFKAFDLNKDGVLSLREVAAVGRVFGYKLSKEEICDMFGKGNLDLNSGIDFEEFVVAMHTRMRSQDQQGRHFAPYKEAFRLYDATNKGYITSETAYPVLRQQLGFDLNKTEEFIDTYDKNKDYRLSLPEFIPFYDKVCELTAQVQRVFKEFDRNGDGLVDKVEAENILVNEKGFSKEEVYNVFLRFDRDGDGMLNYAEFAAFWNVPIH